MAKTRQRKWVAVAAIPAQQSQNHKTINSLSPKKKLNKRINLQSNLAEIKHKEVPKENYFASSQKKKEKKKKEKIVPVNLIPRASK